MHTHIVLSNPKSITALLYIPSTLSVRENWLQAGDTIIATSHTVTVNDAWMATSHTMPEMQDGEMDNNQ